MTYAYNCLQHVSAALLNESMWWYHLNRCNCSVCSSSYVINCLANSKQIYRLHADCRRVSAVIFISLLASSLSSIVGVREVIRKSVLCTNVNSTESTRYSGNIITMPCPWFWCTFAITFISLGKHMKITNSRYTLNLRRYGFHYTICTTWRIV